VIGPGDDKNVFMFFNVNKYCYKYIYLFANHHD